MAPLLRISNLEVVYHRHALAVQGISLSVHEGSFVAVLGTNGAGKTTVLRAVAGFLEGDDVEITDGSIEFDGQGIIGRPPADIAALGVALVPEREKIFQTLTVEENLRLSQIAARRKAPVDRSQVLEYFPALSERQKLLAGYLSGGERQMLAIASGLLAGPRLLLVDELSLGLAPLLVEEQMGLLRRLPDELGVTILLVEQNVTAALEVADYGYVLESGRIVFSGDANELRESDDVREFYLGGGGADRSYRDVKQYRRKRRWYG